MKFFKNNTYYAVLIFSLLITIAILIVYAGKPSDYNEKDYKKETRSGNTVRYVDLTEEDFWGGGERHVRVKNESGVSAYVRITLDYRVTDGEGGLCEYIISDNDYLSVNSDFWIQIGSSYYSKTPLDPGKYSPFFIESQKAADSNGNRVDLYININGIASSDVASLETEWGIKVDEKGQVTGGFS